MKKDSDNAKNMIPRELPVTQQQEILKAFDRLVDLVATAAAKAIVTRSSASALEAEELQ